ncbi:unnamed protein product [Linum trigynum]|uniref:DUF674 domain-containing protein n=1 Tax=Linum trigynum TaxID=586398 RepID=A0AAV2GQX8_9ROSI
MATRKVTLKLLINKKTKKVLFAEAGKDFVDFLFTLLSFPLGTVIKLLSKNKMVGCLGNLYESIEELSDTFFQPNLGKATVLNPKLPSRPCGSTILLSDGGENDGTGATRKFYMCGTHHHRNVADNPQAICPQCSGRMQYEIPFVIAPAAAAGNDGAGDMNSQEGGFVKGVITYMVMDNLEVKPMSTISSITMLNKFNIQEVGALEEKVIELGVDEGLDLLKASLQSQTVLTSVFLGA